MNEASPNNITLPAAPLQDALAKASAYKKGAMVGAGFGLLVSLFLVKGRYVLCTVGGGLIGGYFNYKMTEVKQAPPAFVNYGTTDPVEQPPAPAQSDPTQQDANISSLQTELINSADGK